MTKEADPQPLRMPPFQVLAFAVTHRSVIRRKVYPLLMRRSMAVFDSEGYWTQMVGYSVLNYLLSWVLRARPSRPCASRPSQ